MIRCPKCLTGCLVPEPQEYPLPDTVKCLNCAWRLPVVITPKPERTTCCNCANAPVEGKTYCQRCLDTMANWKVRRKYRKRCQVA